MGGHGHGCGGARGGAPETCVDTRARVMTGYRVRRARGYRVQGTADQSMDGPLTGARRSVYGGLMGAGVQGMAGCWVQHGYSVMAGSTWGSTLHTVRYGGLNMGLDATVHTVHGMAASTWGSTLQCMVDSILDLVKYGRRSRCLSLSLGPCCESLWVTRRPRPSHIQCNRNKLERIHVPCVLSCETEISR